MPPILGLFKLGVSEQFGGLAEPRVLVPRCRGGGWKRQRAGFGCSPQCGSLRTEPGRKRPLEKQEQAARFPPHLLLL